MTAPRRGSRLAWLLVGELLLGACAGPVGSSQPTITPPSLSATGGPGFQPPTAATLLPDEPPPAGAKAEFKTDFSRHSVSYSEILSGGPPKDGIPAINEPHYVGVGEANAWLRPQEPVVVVQVGNDARAFPIQILIWHEIVNAEIGGVPLLVTFCPLCNTAIAFERRLDGQVLDFGTTGRLRFSNLIMYDRQTETWWQQATGEAVAGKFTGRQLVFSSASIIAWETFKSTYPGGTVLSRDTGYKRDYGRNPYVGYDDVNQSPFLYTGPATPGRLPPMARVVTVALNGAAVAYPYSVLQHVGVVNDNVADAAIAVFWSPGTVSPLDAGSVAGGRDIGTAGVFNRELDGQLLNFKTVSGRIVDETTGSTWSILGQATDGPLAGHSLRPVIAINHFWFSWAAFRPDTRVYRP